jgi:hypothetical protein
MKPRYPNLNFESTKPHWLRSRELAHFYNAASTIPEVAPKRRTRGFCF